MEARLVSRLARVIRAVHEIEHFNKTRFNMYLQVNTGRGGGGETEQETLLVLEKVFFFWAITKRKGRKDRVRFALLSRRRSYRAACCQHVWLCSLFCRDVSLRAAGVSEETLRRVSV